MLVSVPTPLSAADLKRYVKGSSSRWVHQELPGRRDFGWQRGFAAFSVSRSRFQQVCEYIACRVLGPPPDEKCGLALT